MTTYIFLDDVRMPPDDGNKWTVVRHIDDAWASIVTAWHTSHGRGEIVISLDHDLGEDIPTGYDLVKHIECAVATQHEFKPKLEMRIHSANPVGRQNMERGIQSIYRLLGK